MKQLPSTAPPKPEHLLMQQPVRLPGLCEVEIFPNLLTFAGLTSSQEATVTGAIETARSVGTCGISMTIVGMQIAFINV